MKTRQSVTINIGTIDAFKKHIKKKKIKGYALIEKLVKDWIDAGKPAIKDIRSELPTYKRQFMIYIEEDYWKLLGGAYEINKSELIENLILNYLNGGK